jgi:predicted DNA-binding transcriptional regulator AlpA
MWCARDALKCLQRLLTRQDLAGMCGITVRYVDMWVKKGKLPKPIYIAPHNPRWCPSEVQQWLKTRPRQLTSRVNRQLTSSLSK